MMRACTVPFVCTVLEVGGSLSPVLLALCPQELWLCLLPMHYLTRRRTISNES